MIAELRELPCTTSVYFLRDREARPTSLRTRNDIEDTRRATFGIFSVVTVCLAQSRRC
jgi:hypothetical protein